MTAAGANALAIKSDSRILLHKCLDVYVEQKDWPQALEILAQLTQQESVPAIRAKLKFTRAIIHLDELSETLTLTSICGLGQVVPAPIKSVIRHFRDEIDEHILRGRCPSGVCPMA